MDALGRVPLLFSRSAMMVNKPAQSINIMARSIDQSVKTRLKLSSFRNTGVIVAGINIAIASVKIIRPGFQKVILIFDISGYCSTISRAKNWRRRK
jgi:hypothetical protein